MFTFMFMEAVWVFFPPCEMLTLVLTVMDINLHMSDQQNNQICVSYMRFQQ